MCTGCAKNRAVLFYYNLYVFEDMCMFEASIKERGVGKCEYIGFYYCRN